MMRKLAILCVLFAGCQAASPDGAPAPAFAPPMASLRVAAGGRTDAFGMDTRELEMTLAWPAGAGQRATLEIYAPGGSLYQRVVEPVDAAGAARFLMPVAGTFVTQYQLAGQWEVRAYPVGESSPIASAEFLVW